MAMKSARVRARERVARWMAMATKRVRALVTRGMAMATRVAGDEKGNGNGDKEGNVDQRQHNRQWPQ